MHLSPSPVPPRTDEIAPKTRDRLLTQDMAVVLGGESRVYAAHDDYSKDEAPKPPWGRGVVMIGRALWSTQEVGDRRRVVRILFRAECRPASGGYDASVMLELAHREAHRQLEGWRPDLKFARVLYPMFRRSAPSEPEWDDERGLWFSTAEYRLAVGPAL